LSVNVRATSQELRWQWMEAALKIFCKYYEGANIHRGR
jgi:hypothetical protein